MGAQRHPYPVTHAVSDHAAIYVDLKLPREALRCRPIPASSSMTTRHRLNRGGPTSNSALYGAAIARLHYRRPTQACFNRRWRP